MIEFYPHQLDAVFRMHNGSLLQGGVGSGKTLTSILYYYTKECAGKFSATEITEMQDPKDLYVITTAKKRDSLDWEREAAIFGIINDGSGINGVKLIVDSWNNIKKYIDVENAFFIFDEQRVVGSGTWVKSFLKITKKNNWILLSATPGDTWMDYIPVFIANGFYKNRTEFIRRHVVYKRFIRFPKIDHYVEVSHLERLKAYITIPMDYIKPTTSIYSDILVSFNKIDLDTIIKKRWNLFTDKPIKDASQLFYAVRKVVNMDPSRFIEIQPLLDKHQRLIIFYNFDYELEILRKFKERKDIEVAEYNGHKHEAIPESNRWLYLVQYMSGGEGWNCTSTNAMVFYSLNYSYRTMTQAAGRIDRLNTPFDTLYYYRLVSDSFIDKAIMQALKNKKRFNERTFDLASQT